MPRNLGHVRSQSRPGRIHSILETENVLTTSIKHQSSTGILRSCQLYPTFFPSQHRSNGHRQPHPTLQLRQWQKQQPQNPQCPQSPKLDTSSIAVVCSTWLFSLPFSPEYLLLTPLPTVCSLPPEVPHPFPECLGRLCQLRTPS